MNTPDKQCIFDPIRRKTVALTPEERVRQAVVHLLVHQLQYPPLRIANEYTISVGKLTRRCDTVVFDEFLNPLMVLEYKAPHIPLTQAVVEQAFQYNSALEVPYICLSNGKQTIVYKIGYNGSPTIQLPGLPAYSHLKE